MRTSAHNAVKNGSGCFKGILDVTQATIGAVFNCNQRQMLIRGHIQVRWYKKVCGRIKLFIPWKCFSSPVRAADDHPCRPSVFLYGIIGMENRILFAGYHSP